MTEEVKTEETVVVETPVETAPVKTPQEKNKELQGERKTQKKKINRFTEKECKSEIFRLENAGHQFSTYYLAVKDRLKAIQLGQGGRYAGRSE